MEQNTYTNGWQKNNQLFYCGIGYLDGRRKVVFPNIIMYAFFRWLVCCSAWVVMQGLVMSQPVHAQHDYEVWFRAEPNGDLFVNGDFVAHTPFMVTISPGIEFEVEIRAEGYMPWVQKIITDNLSTEFVANLQPGAGTVYLQNLPPESRLWLDGDEIFDVETGLEVEGPSQQLRVRLPNGRIVRQPLVPLHDQSRSLELVRDMHLGIFLRSMLLPGWGQARDGHRLEGIAFLVAFLGTATFLYQSEHTFRESVTEYERARSRYQAAIMEAEIVQRREAMLRWYDDTIHNNHRRETALKVFVGTYAANLASAFLLHTIGYAFVPDSQTHSASFRLGGGVLEKAPSLRATLIF